MDVESAETFEAVGDGTRMRWVWKVKGRGAAGRLMAPVLARVIERRLEGAFANIKRILEGEAPAARMAERV